jgi:hypothetical protein
MTAKMKQHVVSRRGSMPSRSFRSSTTFSRQRGSLNHSTVAILFGVVLLCTLSVAGFFYLQQVLATSNQGTDIHDLESKVMELKNQARAAELRGAQLRSLQTIQNNVRQLNLVPSGPVAYLVNPSQKVALAR